MSSLIEEFKKILNKGKEGIDHSDYWHEARGFAQAIDIIVYNGVSEENKDISLSELNEIRMLAKKEELL